MSGIGGSYEIKGGKKVQREAPTRDHPDGNRARPLQEVTSDEDRGTSTKKQRAPAKESNTKGSGAAAADKE